MENEELIPEDEMIVPERRKVGRSYGHKTVSEHYAQNTHIDAKTKSKSTQNSSTIATSSFKEIKTKEAWQIMLKALQSFVINLVIMLLSFWYCYANDDGYRELTTNVFGTYYVWRINWWWYILGIVFIVYLIRTIYKYNLLKEAYLKYKSCKTKK